MRWEKLGRCFYGTSPIVPEGAFLLELRKVAPPTPTPSKAQESLERSQVLDDLATGRLVSVLRTSMQVSVLCACAPVRAL